MYMCHFKKIWQSRALANVWRVTASFLECTFSSVVCVCWGRSLTRLARAFRPGLYRGRTSRVWTPRLRGHVRCLEGAARPSLPGRPEEGPQRDLGGPGPPPAPPGAQGPGEPGLTHRNRAADRLRGICARLSGLPPPPGRRSRRPRSRRGAPVARSFARSLGHGAAGRAPLSPAAFMVSGAGAPPAPLPRPSGGLSARHRPEAPAWVRPCACVCVTRICSNELKLACGRGDAPSSPLAILCLWFHVISSQGWVLMGTVGDCKRESQRVLILTTQRGIAPCVQTEVSPGQAPLLEAWMAFIARDPGGKKPLYGAEAVPGLLRVRVRWSDHNSNQAC